MSEAHKCPSAPLLRLAKYGGTAMPSFDVEIARARMVRIEDEIARRGIKLCGRGVDRCGPCPVCGGHDRFSINIRKQVFRCRAFSGGDTIALVQHLDDCGFKAAIEKLVRDWSIAPVRPAPARPESPGLYECRQHQKAAWLWRRGQSITGTVAEKYLCSRGINFPLPATLRYLPPSKPEHHPAMMAAFGLAEEPEPGVPAAPQRVDAVHLTVLRPDGAGKAEVPKPKIALVHTADRRSFLLRRMICLALLSRRVLRTVSPSLKRPASASGWPVRPLACRHWPTLFHPILEASPSMRTRTTLAAAALKNWRRD